MIEPDTVKLLRECDAGVKMGISSIEDVEDRVRSHILRAELEQFRADHQQLAAEISAQLHRCRDDGKNPNPILKGMSWIKTNTGAASYREMDEACEKLPIGAHKLLYLPYLMGERTPILDADARGVFFGLSAMHTREHMARAVIEGVSYSLYSCLEILREMDVAVDDMALCGGGSKSRFWQQLLCDLYGVPIKTVRSPESAALGAAILGGCAAGVYASVAEGCERTVRANEPLQPNQANTHEYRRFYALYCSLYTALKERFAALAAL